MEVRPFGVKVSISFPPDTDTPQLEEELTQRMPVVKELTSYGNVFKPEQIARGVWEGVVSGAFQITHGFDGFLLGVLCAGTSPVTSLCDTLLQVSFIFISFSICFCLFVGCLNLVMCLLP